LPDNNHAFGARKIGIDRLALRAYQYALTMSLVEQFVELSVSELF